MNGEDTTPTVASDRVDLARLVQRPLYILLAGADHPAEGTAGNVVGVFDTEGEARAAFANVRLNRRLPSDWAELVSVDETSRVQVRAWYGKRNSVARTPAAPHRARMIFRPESVAEDGGLASWPLITRRSKWSRRAVVAVVLVTAAVLLSFARSSTRLRWPETGITEPGFGVVGHTVARVERVVYEPGTVRVSEPANESYAVLVLSGTLSVYGSDCGTRSYGPGQSYVAGWERYVTANWGATPVEAVISHMTPLSRDSERPASPHGEQPCAS